MLLIRIQNILDPMSAIRSADWNFSSRCVPNDNFWAVGRPHILRFEILSNVANMGNAQNHENTVFWWKTMISMIFPDFPHLARSINANFVDIWLLKSSHLSHIAPKSSNLGSESRSSGLKCSQYDSEALFTVTKPWKPMKNHGNPWKSMKSMKNHENHEKPWKYSVLDKNL